MKKLIFLTISFMISISGSSINAQFCNGTSNSSPYSICDMSDLQYLANTIGNYSNPAYTFILRDHIGTLSVPVTFRIGSQNPPYFSGILDGNNKTITLGHVMTSSNSTTDRDAGLFPVLSSFELNNLTLTGNLSLTNYSNAGVFVGSLDKSLGSAFFNNCTSSVTNFNVIPGPASLSYVSGFIGYVSNINILSFSNSVNSTPINIAIAPGQRLHLGGVIGCIGICNNLSLTNCRNDSVVSSGEIVGGLIGHIQSASSSLTAVISNCVNNGNISGEEAGGIVGRIETGTITIQNTHNYGSVTGGTVAGIISQLGGDPFNATFINCTNNGTVSGTNAAGGMIGGIDKASAALRGCINNGNITSDNGTAGGLVGISTNNSTLIFTDCVNNGDVTAFSEAGGMMGYSISFSSFVNCVNICDITSENETAGGMLGISSGEVEFSDCENYGYIKSKKTGKFCGGCLSK